MFKKTKKKGDLSFGNIREIKKVIKKNMKDELLNLAYEHFLESFPDTISDNGGRKTDNSPNGWVKRKKDYSHPALNKTGNLMASIDIDKDSVYTDLEYASYQNYGTIKSGGWLPAREFIGNSIELINKSKKYILDRIKALMK